jgi:PAS domain S-box-containing protein
MTSAGAPAAGVARGRMTIRSRILLLALAVLLPSALTLAWRLGCEIRQSREEAWRTVTLLRDGTARQMTDTLRHADALLQSVAERPRIRAVGDASACQSAIQATPLLQAGFMRLEMRTPSGQLLCWSSHAPLPQDAGAPGPAARPGLGQARPDPATGRLVVPMSHPMTDPSGASTGELRLILDLAAVSENLARETADGAVITVVDGTSAILMTTLRPSDFIGRRGPAIDPGACEARGIVDASGSDSIDRLYACGSIPGTGWRVLAGLPRDHVYAAYTQALQRTIVVGSLVLLLACVLTWQLASAIARPMRALQKAARRIATGDLGHVVVEGPPELQDVAEDFNRMVDALALSRSRLQALFDTMSEAVVTVDDDQTVVMANPAAATLFRCMPQQLVGSKLDRWIPQRAREAHRVEVARYGASGAGPRDMGRRPALAALCFDGQETPIEASISMVEVDGRRFFTAVLRDVSERRKAMEALARNKALLNAALSSMSDAVAILDAQGRFIAVNDAFAAFYRLPASSPAPRRIGDLVEMLDIRFVDGRPATAGQCAGLQALAGQSGTGVLYRLQRVDGGEPWIGSFNYAPIRDEQGVITGAVATARDVTAQLAAQQELEHSRDALRNLVGALDRSLDDERRRISRELHDDLQQTLAAIGMECAAASHLAPSPQAALQDALRRIESLSRNALRSTRRIIADLRPQLLEELGLAAALCNMADMHARRYHMHCKVEVEDDFDSRALPDRVATCLYRVAQEALHNIAKHAGATQACIRLHMAGVRGVRLEIHDDGRGFGDAAASGRKGFGLLGMSERVHALRGSLRLHSKPGGGAVVEVELPLADDCEDGASPDSTPPISQVAR